MAKTTNILDLNNRLEKVEKENVAQNSYTSLKNKPKINNVTLTGNKSLVDIGAAAAADLGVITDLTTTDKSSVVAAINEVNKYTLDLGIISGVDKSTFVKNACIAFRALNPQVNKPYSIMVVWENNARYTGQFTFFNDAADVILFGDGGSRIYCGWYNFQADYININTYMNSDKGYSSVSLDSAYDAGTDWNIVKQGNICVMNMRDLKDIPNGTTKIGTIPVGFSPESGFYEYVYSGNTAAHFGFQIGSDGDIYIFNTTGSTTGTINVNRNITYFTA